MAMLLGWCGGAGSSRRRSAEFCSSASHKVRPCVGDSVTVTQCDLGNFEIVNFDHTLDPPNGAEVGDATTASGTTAISERTGRASFGGGSFGQVVGRAATQASGADGTGSRPIVVTASC